DTITFIVDDKPQMLFSDSKASVIMSIDDAEISVEPELIDDKTIIRFINKDGFTITLNMTAKGSRELGRQMFNAMRVRNGLHVLEDVDQFVSDEIERMDDE